MNETVAKRQSNRLYITGPARRDLVGIAKWSQQKFGEAAAQRYRTLILQALEDIKENPMRPGSQERRDLMIDGARTYHLSPARAA
jgi:plasmid stabilization system protein ParE